MRLDQVQPVGRNHSIVEVTNYCLSETGLIIMEQFLEWFCYKSTLNSNIKRISDAKNRYTTVTRSRFVSTEGLHRKTT
jgi:hypothetical protein